MDDEQVNVPETKIEEEEEIADQTVPDSPSTEENKKEPSESAGREPMGNRLPGSKPDAEKPSELPKKTLVQSKLNFGNRARTRPSSWSQRDTEDYRQGYPGKKDDKNARDNYLFYMNKLSSKPDGALITEIHKEWYGDFDRLERHHGYIQWLFPIREQGMNFRSQELQRHEAESIKKNKEARQRVVTSFKLMLNFYGMKLDEKSGDVGRGEHWAERYHHLNRSMHNYLRITRILKSLGELGHERLQVRWAEFLLDRKSVV